MTELLELLNKNSGALTVLFTAVVTAATVVYAALTWILVKETRMMREVQTEPKLQVTVSSFDFAIHIVRLHVQNVGLGPALNVTFKPKVLAGGQSAEKLLAEFTDVNFFRLYADSCGCMRAHLFLHPRPQPGVGVDRPTLESCPRSVADSWRHWAGRNHETASDALRLVLFFRIPRSQPTAGDLRRSPSPARHLGPAKKTAVCSGCGLRHRTFYDRTTRRVRDTDAAGWRIYVAFEQRRVACARCQGVKVERLDWLAQNPRYTQRFAQQVGPLCRNMSNKAVAQLLHLHEHTVKDLDIQYMQAWLARTPQPAPRVIGVDELSIKKGHTYRIVVSDLERGRPIWIGGQGRTEADLDRFFLDLGPKKTARIRLAVMDRWKAFRNSVQTHAPQAQLLFDKFHILRHLADAMDQVRRDEYKRVAAKDRAFSKGQRYTLLSHRANLTLAGRRSLRKLLWANKRLATAYLLKEEFGQLWSYRREGWARQFFMRWRAQLNWQRLRPFEQFAALIERHWDGIVTYCEPRNKVKLGFVEGLNNKIRVIQRRAYGYRDEEYMRLKILTAFLPKQ